MTVSNKAQTATKMNKHYILIDYENVQMKSLSVLLGAPHQAFRIMVFVGANQSKLPIELVSSMQSFGAKAQYVQITGSGRNALDFHIAYYLGSLTESDPHGIFHIISKDTGYDQSIKRLKGKKIDAARLSVIWTPPSHNGQVSTKAWQPHYHTTSPYRTSRR